jgi:hypothetical protein
MSSAGFQQKAESECEQFERRWQERQPSLRPVPLRLFADRLVSFTAFAQDVSSMGIGLVSTHSIEVGTDLRVRCQDGLLTALTARVVHVQPISDGRFFLGCSPSRALTGREVDILLGANRSSPGS